MIASQAQEQNTALVKHQCRRALLTLRRNLHATDVLQHSASITQCVLSLPQWQEAKHMALYCAADHEVDTTALLETAWQTGKRVSLPRCLPAAYGEGRMVFAVCEGWHDLQQGAFGLREPREHCPIVGGLPAIPHETQEARDVEYNNHLKLHDKQSITDFPELMLVPAVGISPEGYRLGYGKGYYDRLLAQEGWQTVCRLGLAYQLQITAIPTAPQDMPLHGFVTERGVTWV